MRSPTQRIKAVDTTERKIRWTLSYVLNLILATIGMLICMFLFAALPARFDPLRGPHFWGPIVFGMIAGIFVGRKARPSVLALLWVIPALLVAWELHGWLNSQYAGENVRQEIFNDFIGRDCGASECMVEGFLVSPLISSVFYGAFGLISRLGFTRKVVRQRSAAIALAATISFMIAGCKSAPAPTPAALPRIIDKTTYPPRPTITPPPFRVFHTTDNSITLVTAENATDDQIAAIIWQLHDAARAHSFDELHIPQQLVDKRDPMVWFHIYRGAKCASEKYTTGTVPCGASYHAAGDYTLGSFSNKDHDDGVLVHGDYKQIELWNPDAP